MRILAIECEPTNLKGGSERSYFDVLTGLVAKGHQVTLLYARPGNLLPDYNRLGVRTVQTDLSLMVVPGSRWNNLKTMWHTSNVVKSLGALDIIYTNFSETLPLVWLLRWRSNVPVVCHIRLGYYGLSRQILLAGRSVAAFIVINKKLQPVFEKVFKATNKVHVVYNGVTIPASLPSLKAERRTEDLRVLYLGRIAPDKGIVELVRSFAATLKRGVKASLQITGSYLASYTGNYEAELAETIASCGVSHLVSIAPPVANPVEYISGFDLFVFPSTWDEPFGRTVPEAILAGTPTLARKVGMIDEIMVDNPAFVFDSDEMLASKLVDFYNGSIRFNVESARQTIREKFSKDRMIDEVEQILKDQLG